MKGSEGNERMRGGGYDTVAMNEYGHGFLRYHLSGYLLLLVMIKNALRDMV